MRSAGFAGALIGGALAVPLAAQQASELVAANACVDAAFTKHRSLVTLKMSEDDMTRLKAAVFTDCDAVLRRHGALAASRLGLPPERALAMAQVNAGRRIEDLAFPVRTELLNAEHKKQAEFMANRKKQADAQNR